MSTHKCKFCNGPLDTVFKCLLCKKHDLNLIKQFSMDGEFRMTDVVVDNPIVLLS